VDDDAAVAAGLRQSLESTRQGLQCFVDSLRASGMAGAAPAYRQLRSVLVQQRLWAESHGKGELIPLFRAIAEVAAAARTILAPYAEVMAGLEDLDRLTEIRIEAAVPPRAATAPALSPELREGGLAGVVAALLIHGPSSYRRLAWLSDVPDSGLASGLKRLVDAGVVRRKGWGRSASYLLSDSFVQSILGPAP
jgi:hypothetical protein